MTKLFVILSFAATQLTAQVPAAPDSIPPLLLGGFEDDYGEKYSVTQSEWSGPGGAVMQIVKWANDSRFLVVRNDPNDPNYGGMWTRIDWMELEGMPPYEWAYCFTVYDATSMDAAEDATPADRATPRTGCGGFPFSRMKKQ